MNKPDRMVRLVQSITVFAQTRSPNPPHHGGGICTSETMFE